MPRARARAKIASRKKFALYTQFASKNLRQVLEWTRKNALAYNKVASGGRYLSIDPVVTDANTGSAFNRYWYANNNPYKYIDPDGRWGVPGMVYGAIAGGVGGSVASGSPFMDKAVGTLSGAFAGGMVGAVAPQTSHIAGLAAAGAVASAAGQATGSVVSAAANKGVTNISRSDVKIDAVTTVLGAVGSGIGGVVGQGISQSTMRPIIGQTLQMAGTPTTAGLVVGSVVEGVISGGAEKAAPKVTAVINETTERIKQSGQ